jgi:hypothetical protein
MTPRAKALVRVSLAEYNSAKSYHKKASLVKYVERQLERNTRSEIISADDYNIAGRVFLRIIKNQKP